MRKVENGFLSRLFLFLLVFCIGVGISSAEASEDRLVSYTVKNVSLDGDKVTFDGSFKNETDVFQRVNEMTLRYVLSDVDGYPLLMGKFRVNDVDVTVGDTEIPYTVTADNMSARQFSTDDVAVWRIETEIKVDE